MHISFGKVRTNKKEIGVVRKGEEEQKEQEEQRVRVIDGGYIKYSMTCKTLPKTSQKTTIVASREEHTQI